MLVMKAVGEKWKSAHGNDISSAMPRTTKERTGELVSGKAEPTPQPIIDINHPARNAVQYDLKIPPDLPLHHNVSPMILNIGIPLSKRLVIQRMTLSAMGFMGFANFAINAWFRTRLYKPLAGDEQVLYVVANSYSTKITTSGGAILGVVPDALFTKIDLGNNQWKLYYDIPMPLYTDRNPATGGFPDTGLPITFESTNPTNLVYGVRIVGHLIDQPK